MFGKYHGRHAVARAIRASSVRARIGIAGGTLAGLTTAALVLATSASATVTFDPSTGLGFVGKGDVQTAFGWNNQTAQKELTKPADVTFSYNSTEDYTAVCEFTTGTGTRGQQTHDVQIPRQTSVNGAIDWDARVHNQIDGIYLTGLGNTTYLGTVPVVGQACVGNQDGVDFNGTWISVTDNGALPGAGLYVSDSDDSLGPVLVYSAS